MNNEYVNKMRSVGIYIILAILVFSIAVSASGLVRAQDASGDRCSWTDTDKANRYSYFENLETFKPGTPLKPDEMRITFMGSGFPPARRAQESMSIFVEVGGDDQREADQFIFDIGSGVSANYVAMGVGYGMMDKIFLTHLHSDHMGDLDYVYTMGPSTDRKYPLYVWGPGNSGVKSPMPSSRLYDDGTQAFCKNLREAMRWHTESFSFQPTSYPPDIYTPPTWESWGLPCDPIPVGDDTPNDGYALIPIELEVAKEGVAYSNPATGVTITYFPTIHTRKGSIGYKLEWNNLTMIYTGDTKPEWNCVNQAINRDENGVARGVDVFIHEMIIPPDVLPMKMIPGATEPIPNDTVIVKDATAVIDSSHTTQGAFGYLLNQIEPHPRLTVATHFPVADDTVECAYQSVQNYCPWVVWDQNNPDENTIVWSFDLMVISVTKDNIEILQGDVNDFSSSSAVKMLGEPNPPKYHTPEGNMDPYAQIDLSTEIPAYNNDTQTWNYAPDGY